MQTGLPVDELGLSRIRVVTRRYQELNGLLAALVGCGFCLMAVVASLEPPRTLVAAFMMVVFITMLFVGQWLQEEYYPRRFGRVHTSEGMNQRAWIWVVGTSVCSLIDSKTVGEGVPATFPLFVGGQSLWVVFRDWPLRSYHTIVVVAGLVGSVLYCRANLRNQAEWLIAAGILLGIAFIVAGVGDHRLLASILDNPEARFESRGDEQSI